MTLFHLIAGLIQQRCRGHGATTWSRLIGWVGSWPWERGDCSLAFGPSDEVQPSTFSCPETGTLRTREPRWRRWDWGVGTLRGRLDWWWDRPALESLLSRSALQSPTKKIQATDLCSSPGTKALEATLVESRSTITETERHPSFGERSNSSTTLPRQADRTCISLPLVD